MGTTKVFLPGKSDGQRSLVGYSYRLTRSQTQLSGRARTLAPSYSTELIVNS